MCLNRLLNEPFPKGVQKGFKGLTESGNHLIFNWDKKHVKPGVWMKATGKLIHMYRGATRRSHGFYPAGFHIYKSKAATISWGHATLMVEFKHVVAIGQQEGKCYVAKYIRIPKAEYEAWNTGRITDIWNRYITKAKI